MSLDSSFEGLFEDPPAAPSEPAEFSLEAPPPASVARRSRKKAAAAPTAPEPAPTTVEPPAVLAKRRRSALTIAVLVSLGLLAMAYFNQPSHRASLTQLAPAAASAQPVSADSDVAQALISDLSRAEQFRAANGTFRGFAPTAPITGAAGNTALVLAFSSSQGCFFTGIAPGFDTAVKKDATGANCDAAALAEVQSELDSADGAVSDAASSGQNPTLSTAVSVAQYWASHNFVGGKASFSGLDPATLGGAKVLSAAPDSSWVVLAVSGSGGCSAVKVNLSSTEPASC